MPPRISMSGVEGHPAGSPATRRRGRKRGDLIPCKLVLGRVHRTVTSPTSKEPRLPDTHRRLPLPLGEHVPAPSDSHLRVVAHGRRRCEVAPPPIERCADTITRENTGPNIVYRLPIVLGIHPRLTGSMSMPCLRDRLGEHDFPDYVRPGDGREGINQFVRVDRGRRRQPCPPGDRRCRDRRLCRLRDAAREGGDHAPIVKRATPIRSFAQPGGRALLASELDRHRARGSARRHLAHATSINADTHMTLDPVAVNYQCWASRRASCTSVPTANEIDGKF